MRPGGPVEFPHPSVPSNRVTRPSQLFIALAMKGCSQSVSPGTDTRPNRGGTSQRERCKADARVKTLQDRLKAAKDEFKARGVETAAGERFTVVRSETVRWSLDTAAVKAEMGADWCTRSSRTTHTVSLRITPIRAAMAQAALRRRRARGPGRPRGPARAAPWTRRRQVPPPGPQRRRCHGRQLTEIWLSDGCGGKTITTAAQFEYDRHVRENSDDDRITI